MPRLHRMPAIATDDAAAQSVQVLTALRRIMRATDLHSKRLTKHAGLTIPQVVVLQAIRDLGEVTTGMLSVRVSLSQATVTSILDRLEERGLVERYRSTSDRRVVHARLTGQGRSVLRRAPSLLHETFLARFEALPPAGRGRIVAALEQVTAMMDAADLAADPILDIEP